MEASEAAFRPKEVSEPSRVMFVDDEQLILDEYLELLAFEGLLCEGEKDPFRAFDRIMDDIDIRMVITDNRMPGMTGPELIRRLRLSLPKERRVNFALLSGYEEAMTAEFADVVHLLKPIDVDALVTTVRSGLAD